MAEHAPARIAVIDDHRSVRLSLRALLETADFAVHDFESAPAFLAWDQAPSADCLIVDVQMPEMTGLELQQELIRRNMPTPLILVTAQASVPLAVQAMRAGAFDFLEKPFDDDVLMDSIHRAIRSGKRMMLQDGDIRTAIELLTRLTDRERDVLNLLTLGETNKVIGHQLGISPRTVEVHRARVLEKMGARNVADLVRTVRAAGMLQ